MSEINKELVEKFTTMATAVNATVVELPSREDAYKYVVDLTVSKDPCEMLADEPGTEKGPLGPNRVPTRVQRILSVPQLNDEEFASVEAYAKEKGNILCIREGVRKYGAGLDVGVINAVAGVAASGTCLCPNTDEDVRLSSMLCEISVLLLDKSTIRPDLPSIAGLMRECIGQGPEPSFNALITGPSRTADIECVGAVGVHGPLAMHIILLEA
ncbi:MAG: lactate utilization protein [Desulfovibrionaceae bacterium]|nr:lactate utilization protein [Desulfovibrionaceae bacterium]